MNKIIENSPNFRFDNSALICFDVDGIFIQSEQIDYVSGPINPSDIMNLEKQGVFVTIVSPSPYFPKNSENTSLFELCNSEPENDRRHINLENSKERYFQKYNRQPENCIYISDNEDYDESEKAGFVYVDVNDFVDYLSKI